jgi:hypothetical protein
MPGMPMLSESSLTEPPGSELAHMPNNTRRARRHDLRPIPQVPSAGTADSSDVRIKALKSPRRRWLESRLLGLTNDDHDSFGRS